MRPPCRVRRVARDARPPQRLAVHPGRVAVHRVTSTPAWWASAHPAPRARGTPSPASRSGPTLADQPVSLERGAGRGLQALEHLLRGVGPHQRHGGEGTAQPRQVSVRIGEAGHHRRLPEVHHARLTARGGVHLVARAHRQHLAVSHGDRLGQRARRVERPHRRATYTVVVEEGGGFTSGPRRGQPATHARRSTAARAYRTRCIGTPARGPPRTPGRGRALWLHPGLSSRVVWLPASHACGHASSASQCCVRTASHAHLPCKAHDVRALRPFRAAPGG